MVLYAIGDLARSLSLPMPNTQFLTPMFSHSPYPQSHPVGTLYRHGDVLLKRIDSLPTRGLQKKAGTTLAHGEITGHSHRMDQNDRVQLWSRGADLFLEVKNSSATLVHEEHRAIDLPQGIYRVWKQREYRPDTYVDVED